MVVAEKGAILFPSYSVEVSKVPNILCPSCRSVMQVTMGANTKRVVGSCICATCDTGTGFELDKDIVTWVSGKSSYGILSSELPGTAKTLYAEADACYQTGSPDAAAAMCRASIEAALTQAGYSGKSLYEQIEAAKAKQALDDVELGLAHASRLITRDAIHRGALVQLSEVPSMLAATVRILNKLFPA
jgi:hypothetical protein